MSKIKDALFGAADKKSVEEAIEQGGGSGGGGAVFVVNITPTGETEGTADATVGEIKDAVDVGMAVVCNVKNPNNSTGATRVLPLMSINNVSAMFSSVILSGNGTRLNCETILLTPTGASIFSGEFENSR